MDNLFEYLFILFIIISFFSSYFDKKKKAQQKKKAREKGQVNNIPAAKQRQPQRDILEELFGIKQNPPPHPIPQPEKKTEVADQSLDISMGMEDNKTWNPEDEFKDVIPMKAEGMIEKAGTDLEFEDSIKLNAALEKSASEEMQPYYIVEAPNAYESDLKERLRNPRTVREFIIVSELLGKPKALRR